MSASHDELKPPSLGRAVFILTVMQLNAALRGKRVAFLFVLLGVPLFISCVLKAESRDYQENFAIMAPQAYLLFLLPIIALFHGASALAEEVDNRTLGYLLLRPLPREWIALGKFAGAWLATVFILGAGVASAHFVIAWQGSVSETLTRDTLMGLGAFLLIMSAGSAVYVVFSLFLSLRVKRPIFMGLIYLVIVEWVFPWVPGPISNLAISTHLQRLMPSAYTSVEAVVAQEARIVMPDVDPWMSAGLIGLIFGLLSVLALLRFKDYDLSYEGE